MLIVDMKMPKHGCCDCMVELMGLCVIQDKDVPLKNENGDYPTELPKGCPIKGELVRCGECNLYTKIDGYCPYYDSYFPADHICDHGERKDGEHDGE